MHGYSNFRQGIGGGWESGHNRVFLRQSISQMSTLCNSLFCIFIVVMCM